MAEGNKILGKVAFVDKGAYNAATRYDFFNFVTTEDSCYLSLADNNTAPGNRHDLVEVYRQRQASNRSGKESPGGSHTGRQCGRQPLRRCTIGKRSGRTGRQRRK